MDERAEYDMDRAIVAECCESEEEAVAACKDLGFGVVVAPDQRIVFRYSLWRGDL